MFEKIVATFDGSDRAEQALRVAADMAQKYEATLEIVFVPEVPSTVLAVDGSVVEIPMRGAEFDEYCKTVLDRAETIAQEAGSPTKAHLLDGSPAEAIVTYATATDADLIVMGRRGLGTLAGLIMGSVSRKLTEHSKCPVLVVQ